MKWVKFLSILYVNITINFANEALGAQYEQSCDIIVFMGYSYVEANMENYPTPVLFLLDTGTDNFAVNKDLVRNMNLKEGSILKFHLGSITMEHVISYPVGNYQSDSVARLFLGEILEGKLYGGIIGNKVFDDHYVIIDYPQQKLSLLTSSELQNINNSEITYVDYVYSVRQIFIEATLNEKVAGYYHLDTGIPTYSYMEFVYAQEAGLNDLKRLPNTSNKLVEKFIYDDDGNPINRIEEVVTKENHKKYSYCNSLNVGSFQFGKQFFITMDTDMDKEVFTNAAINPIIGSFGYETLKTFIIHIDFANHKIAIL